jgi:hypothetical protein
VVVVVRSLLSARLRRKAEQDKEESRKPMLVLLSRIAWVAEFHSGK